MLPKFRRVMATCFCFWRFPCWKRLANDSDSTISRRTHVAELTELPPGKRKAKGAVGVGLAPSQLPTMQNAMITIGATLLVRPGAQINVPPAAASTEGAVTNNAPSTKGGATNGSTEQGAINNATTDTAQGIEHAPSDAQINAPCAQINAPSSSSPAEGGGNIYVNNAAHHPPSPSSMEGEIVVNNGASSQVIVNGAQGSGSTSKQPNNVPVVETTTVKSNVVHQQNNCTTQFITPVQKPPPTSSPSTESVHYIIPNSKSFHMYPTCTKMYPSPRSNRPLGPERLL